jgi:uncharacterized protein (DUF486 family)
MDHVRQLKTMQEVITLIVFAGFSAVYLREPLTWNQGVGTRGEFFQGEIFG